METAAVKIGQVVKVVDKSQFQRRVWTGAVTALEWWSGHLYARVYRWPHLVPIDQLVPIMKGDLQ